MLSAWLLSGLAVSYLGFLFAVAFYGDRRSIYPHRKQLRPYIYGLSIGVVLYLVDFLRCSWHGRSRGLGLSVDLRRAGSVCAC